MCGRYTMRTGLNRLLQMYGAETQIELSQRYNVAPTQSVPVLRNQADTDAREIVLMRWGLVPGWAKDISIGARMINARAETVEEKPAFRSAFKRRRCLVMADGFYEWQKRGKAKQPFFFHLKDNEPFTFAGLWERWSKEGQTIESCTIITTTPNELLEDVHDRMPAILQERYFDNWLNAAYDHTDRLKEMLSPYPADEMDRHPVRSIVGNPKNDTPDCVEPIELEG